MLDATVEQAVQTLEIIKHEQIAAPPEIVFETLLEHLGPQMQTMPGADLAMKLEAWPGGRWFRDLGNGTGHLWGHVQVIRPPTLLEICGPFCMSYPAINHVQYRLTAEGKTTRLTMCHRAIGAILDEHRHGMPGGWAQGLSHIRVAAEVRATGAREEGVAAWPKRCAHQAKISARAWHDDVWAAGAAPTQEALQ